MSAARVTRGNGSISTNEPTRFRVLQVGDEWVLRRDGALWAAWLEDPVKDLAISKARELAAAFRPSLVIVHHESGPPTTMEFHEPSKLVPQPAGMSS